VVKQTDKKPRVGDGTPGPGRPKGIPNKNTQALKDMILGALDKKGGVDYLMKQADENPTAFLTLIGKVLPMTIAGTGANGQHITELVVRVERGQA
jgi:hypothetical protein